MRLRVPQLLSALRTQLCLSAPFLVCVLSCGDSRKGSQSIYFTADDKPLTAHIQIREGLDPAGLVLTYIGRDGFRYPFGSTETATATGTDTSTEIEISTETQTSTSTGTGLSLWSENKLEEETDLLLADSSSPVVSASGDVLITMDKSKLLLSSDSLYTYAETVAAMGDVLPSYPQGVEAVMKLEITEKRFEKTSGKISYTQFPSFFKRNDLISQDPTSLSNSIVLSDVGYQKVKILSLKDDSPIKEASVMAIVNGEIKSDDGRVTKAWLLPLYRPVLTKTDAKGEAYVYPLNVSGESPTYSLVAYAPDYCTYVSASSAFKVDTPEVVLKLKECPNTDKLGFIVSVNSPSKVTQETDKTIGKIAVGNTNSMFFSLRIDSRTPLMRGIKVKFLEGFGTKGAENKTILPVTLSDTNRFPNKFQSELLMDLPLTFDTSRTENGTFTFQVQSLEIDAGRQKESSDLMSYIYGRKSTVAPTGDFLKTLTLTGDSLQENLIAGDAGSKLFVTVPLCDNDSELVLKTDEKLSVSVACKDGKAVFLVDDLHLDPTGSKQGGKRTFKFYLKDKFGNLSSEDDGATSAITVFVDYGTPDLIKNPFVLSKDIGFTQLGIAHGTFAKPYTFPQGVKDSNGKYDTIIMSAKSQESIVFRFTSPSVCRTEGSDADGLLSSLDGVRLAFYRIGNTGDSLVKAAFSTCFASGETTDYLVKMAKDITYPSDKTQKASFLIEVVDVAGHHSSPYSYEIPPCPTSGVYDNISVCWLP